MQLQLHHTNPISELRCRRWAIRDDALPMLQCLLEELAADTPLTTQFLIVLIVARRM